MKFSMKKLSISIIAGTIILGSVANVGAESFSYRNNNFKKFYTRTYRINRNHAVKPNIPTNNNTTENEIKQDKVVENKDTPTNDTSIESEVLRLVNIERSKQGLAALKLSNELSDVARMKSQDMADKNYFNHTSPTYGSPFDMMKQFGIKYTTAGENIAKGYPSAEAVMKGWMNSQGHKENILSSKFGTLGVGYLSKGGTTYWTQMFTN